MRLKQGCRLFWLALIAFALDRATTVWSLTLEGGVEAVPGLLNFRPVRNYGDVYKRQACKPRKLYLHPRELTWT